jgi:peroxiredoxin
MTLTGRFPKKTMPLKLGDEIPDCILFRPDGSAAHLSDFQGNPLVVIFLRHLG